MTQTPNEPATQFTSLTPGRAPTQRVILKFEKKYDKWNAGELAGFSEEKAMELVKAGVAKIERRTDERPPEAKPGSGGMVDKQTTVGPQTRK